jgi:hypothetical protein
MSHTSKRQMPTPPSSEQFRNISPHAAGWEEEMKKRRAMSLSGMLYSSLSLNMHLEQLGHTWHITALSGAAQTYVGCFSAIRSGSDTQGTRFCRLKELRYAWYTSRRLEGLRRACPYVFTPSGRPQACMARVHAVWRGPDTSGKLFHHLEQLRCAWELIRQSRTPSRRLDRLRRLSQAFTTSGPSRTPLNRLEPLRRILHTFTPSGPSLTLLACLQAIWTVSDAYRTPSYRLDAPRTFTPSGPSQTRLGRLHAV